MNYIQLICTISPYNSNIADMLVADLSEINYESFAETNNGLDAYIQEKHWDKSQISQLPQYSKYKIDYKCKLIKHQNWNKLWEENYFNPIIIANQCLIKAPFHKNTPHLPYEIIIQPQMSFGTGHHETTSMVTERILQENIKDKNILDIGCGTGILAILAKMRKAKEVTAIDIDANAIQNTFQNIQLNSLTGIEVKQTTIKKIPETKKYHIILANLTKNILLEEMKDYAQHLHLNGILITSGYYQQDSPSIKKEAQKYNLQYIHSVEKNKWVCANFAKQ